MHTTLAGNEIWRLVTFFVTLLVATVIGRLLSWYLHHMGSRQEAGDHPVAAAGFRAWARSSPFVFLALGLQQALRVLVLNDQWEMMARTGTSILVVLAIALTAYQFVDLLYAWMAAAAVRTASRLDDMLVPMVRKSLRVTIVVLTSVQVSTMLSDKPLTSVLAGLGIGGLAVALAGQDTIRNFFGSIVILADKPFEMGDRVVVDGVDGSVVEVGFRSTRIRTLDGHLVTIPNGELATKSIQNIGKRPHIRRLANITIPYDTPPEKVERALAILREILRDHEGQQPDFPPRVFFDKFNDASLNLLVLYWYHPPDYWKFLAFSERFNLEVLRRFNAEGIEFAFPTQTLFLAGDPRRPLRCGDRAGAAGGTPGSPPI